MLAPHEGEGYTYFFNALGIHALVLSYRLGSAGHRHPEMLQDACLAMRLIRSEAAGWGIDPDRIGVIGSSAGGHLAATLLTQWNTLDTPEEQVSARPDLGVLAYPVITLEGEFAHVGSRENLLGKEASAELICRLSAQYHVTDRTPPCFLWHTGEDRSVPVENSLLFAGALRDAGVPFELHVFEHGTHGIGMRPGDHPWTFALERWLKVRGWVGC